MMTVVSYVIAAIVLAWFLDMRATTTIMFVRHADTDAAMGQGGDPPLNDVGRARAELLADFLQDVDVLAGVDAIYASEFVRTQETAAPLAGRLGLQIEVDDHYDVVGFMERVLDAHKGEIVLVVTHSDVLGQLVAELHGHQSVPAIAPDEFDNLYIVSIPHFGKVKTLRLPYAIGWHPYDIEIKSGGTSIGQPELGAR
jgi:broad specificity phosphatase PhoE